MSREGQHDFADSWAWDAVKKRVTEPEFSVVQFSVWTHRGAGL